MIIILKQIYLKVPFAFFKIIQNRLSLRLAPLLQQTITGLAQKAEQQLNEIYWEFFKKLKLGIQI